MMEKQNQQLRAIAQAQQELRQKIVRVYRNRTGDYTTSDAVAYQRLEQQYYAQNPQAFQQKLAENQYYAREYQKLYEKSVRDTQYNMQARHAARMDAIQSIGAMNTATFNRRMGSMEGKTAAFSNVIYERGDYYNRATGQTHNLSFHHNQVQSSGGRRFYTDNHGRQHELGMGQTLQPR